MSIEQKLKYQFNTEASQLETPHHLDSAILCNYRRQVMENRSGKMNMKSLYKKAIVISAIVVVLSGFGYGATQFFSTTEGNLTYSVFTTNEFDKPDMSSEELVKTHLAMEEVKAQLNEGESAIIYRPELQNDTPFVTVYKPAEVNEWEKWQQALQSEHIRANEHLLNQKFTFVAGTDVNPFMSMHYYDAEEQGVYELIDQYDNNDVNKLIWKKIEMNLLDLGMENYTTLYKNADDQSVYVVATTMSPPRVAIEQFDSTGLTRVGEPSYEIKQYISTDKSLVTQQIGDFDVSYMQYNSTLSRTGTVQSVTWLEKAANDTIIYSVMTEDTNIKEKTLFDIAKQIIPQ